MLKRKGFTLIELLVVVLIIGILAAIALPQYQKAVEKSHAAEALMILRAIADAEKVYYWATGKYTYRLSDLDITMPGLSFNYAGTLPAVNTKYFSCRGTVGLSGNSTTYKNVLSLCRRLPVNNTRYDLGIRPDGSIFCAYWSEKGRKDCSALDVSEIGPASSFMGD